MDLREKIAEVIAQRGGYHPLSPAYQTALANADSILQIPEIKDALDLAKFITKPRAPGNVWQPVIPE